MTTTNMSSTDLAVLLPMLKMPQNSAAGKMLKAVNNVPKDQLCSFLDTFSCEELLDVLGTALKEYQSNLLPMLEILIQKLGLSVEITGLSVDADGHICLQLDGIDYPAIIGKCRSAILKGDIGPIADSPIMASFITMLRISLKAGLAVLSKVPPKTLDALAVGLINRNANRLLEKINGMLAEKDFSLRLGELKATE